MPENEAKSANAELTRKAEDIRAEYAALSAYFGTVINFRFTTLGFFLAAVGLIVSANVPTRAHAMLLLLVASAQPAKRLIAAPGASRRREPRG